MWQRFEKLIYTRLAPNAKRPEKSARSIRTTDYIACGELISKIAENPDIKKVGGSV